MAGKSKRIGGGNLAVFFALTSSAGAVTFGAPLNSVEQLISTGFTGHFKTKNAVFDFSHDKDNKSFRDMMDTYLPAQGGGDVTKYEDSTPSTVNSGDYTKLVGVLSYGAPDSENNVTVKIAVVQMTGGDEKADADKPNMIKLGGVATLVEFPVVVPGSAFSTTKVGTMATVTVAANSYGCTVYASKP